MRDTYTRPSLLSRRWQAARTDEAGFGLIDIMVAVIILIIATASFAITSITIGNGAAAIRASDLAVTTNNAVLSNAAAFGCGMVTGAEPRFGISLSTRKATCGGLGSYVLSSNTGGITLSAHSSVLYNSTYEPAYTGAKLLPKTMCVPFDQQMTVLQQQASTTYKSATGKTKTAASYAIQAIPTNSPLYHLPVTAQGGVSIMIDTGFTAYYQQDPAYAFKNTQAEIVGTATRTPTRTLISRAMDPYGCVQFPFLPLGTKSATSATSVWTVYMPQASAAPMGKFTLNAAGNAPAVTTISTDCSKTTVAAVPSTGTLSASYKTAQESCSFSSSTNPSGSKTTITALITAWAPA